MQDVKKNKFALLKTNDIINEFNKWVTKDSVKARQIIVRSDYKNNAYFLRCIALTYFDESLFFKNGNMRKTFLLNKLKLAKKYIDKAYNLQCNCRDILFTKGTIYNALGFMHISIDCYINIIENKNNKGCEYNCSGANMQYVKMIINDSYFQLYRLFYNEKEFKLSNKFLIEYKNGLKKGINTIYVPLQKFLM